MLGQKETAKLSPNLAARIGREERNIDDLQFTSLVSPRRFLAWDFNVTSASSSTFLK